MGRGRSCAPDMSYMLDVSPIHSNQLSEQVSISEESFQEALATYAAELNLNVDKVSFASRATSLNDVVDTIREMQSKYQFSKNTKSRKWLNRFSKFMVYYSNIFDMLVQHHPEYVSLACRFWFSPELQSFSNSTTSDLIIIKGTFPLRQAIRDIAVTITEELRQKNAAVLWAIKIEVGQDQARQPSSKDILKSIVAQAMRLSQGVQTDKSMTINCTRMRTADSEIEWIQILASVLAGLNQPVYLALDLAMFRDEIILDIDISHIISIFASLSNDLSAQGLKTKVKIMLFSYKAAPGLAMSSHNVVTVKGDTRPWIRNNGREQQPRRGSSFLRHGSLRSSEVGGAK
jgi:hypothetical protein